jgi:hypothetical protein
MVPAPHPQAAAYQSQQQAVIVQQQREQARRRAELLGTPTNQQRALVPDPGTLATPLQGLCLDDRIRLPHLYRERALLEVRRVELAIDSFANPPPPPYTPGQPA